MIHTVRVNNGCCHGTEALLLSKDSDTSFILLSLSEAFQTYCEVVKRPSSQLFVDFSGDR